MHGIFLSYSFKNDTDPLLQAVRAIIECAGFRVVDGKVLDDFLVGPAVENKIEACAGVVCVITPEADETGWVNAEFFQAVGQGKNRIFVLCEEGIDLGNPMKGVAVSRFKKDEVLIAITTLAGTLGLWSQSLGNPVRAVLLPEAVGQDALNRNAICEYRCEEMISVEESDWRPARLVPIEGGIHAILPTVPREHSVQIRVTFNDKIWKSDFMPQHLRLELK